MTRTTNNKKYGLRVFAEGCEAFRNSFESGHDLIIGSSGSGKTNGYVSYTLAGDSESSFIVSDTKGQLCKTFAKLFKKKGYKVKILDFVNPQKSTTGYDPIKAIRKNRDGSYNQQDIIKISNILVPCDRPEDAYWVDIARNVVACAIGYVLETFDDPDKNFWSVIQVCKEIFNTSDEKTVPFLEEYADEKSESFFFQSYLSFKKVIISERTFGCAKMFLSIDKFEFAEIKKMFTANSLDIASIGKTKTIVFLNTSDTDRSLDRLVNIFYAQLFNKLIDTADKNPDGKLAIATRIIIDDFASSVNIPDFDRLISVIRSREIFVSVILQSLTQLETLYKPSQASTIVNNCDSILYLSGNDFHTAEFLAERMCATPETVLCLARDEVIYIEKGSTGKKFKKLKPYCTLELEKDD